jgi:hypothetical protein
MTAKRELAWAILGIVVRYVIVPAVVIFASSLLSSINLNLDQLKEKVGEVSRVALQTKMESESYKLIVNKQLELLDYRITLLEGIYGRLYPELLSEHAARPTRNASALGKPTNK